MAGEMKSGGDILRYPWPVAAPLSARWALDHDGLEGELLRATRDIAAALFAVHNEGPSRNDHGVSVPGFSSLVEQCGAHRFHRTFCGGCP